MNADILKGWYDGQMIPGERIIPHDDKYLKISKKIGEEREYFQSRLSTEDCERFDEWHNLIFEVEGMSEYANFAYGFELGVMLFCQIFFDADGPNR